MLKRILSPFLVYAEIYSICRGWIAVIIGAGYFIYPIYTDSPEKWDWTVSYWSAWLVSLIGSAIILVNIIPLKKKTLVIPVVVLFNPLALLTIYSGLMWIQLSGIESSINKNGFETEVVYMEDRNEVIGHIRKFSGGTPTEIIKETSWFKYEYNRQTFVGAVVKDEGKKVPFKSVIVDAENPEIYLRKDFDFSPPYFIPFWIGVIGSLGLVLLTVYGRRLKE